MNQASVTEAPIDTGELQCPTQCPAVAFPLKQSELAGWAGEPSRAQVGGSLSRPHRADPTRQGRPLPTEASLGRPSPPPPTEGLAHPPFMVLPPCPNVPQTSGTTATVDVPLTGAATGAGLPHPRASCTAVTPRRRKLRPARASTSAAGTLLTSAEGNARLSPTRTCRVPVPTRQTGRCSNCPSPPPVPGGTSPQHVSPTHLSLTKTPGGGHGHGPQLTDGRTGHQTGSPPKPRNTLREGEGHLPARSRKVHIKRWSRHQSERNPHRVMQSESRPLHCLATRRPRQGGRGLWDPPEKGCRGPPTPAPAQDSSHLQGRHVPPMGATPRHTHILPPNQTP